MKDIEVHKVGEVLDASTSKIEQEAITQILDQGKNVALDLSGCKYVSSAGLRVMLYSYKVAAMDGLKLFLIGVSEEVREVMAITGFERFFSFYQTVETAMTESSTTGTQPKRGRGWWNRLLWVRGLPSRAAA